MFIRYITCINICGNRTRDTPSNPKKYHKDSVSTESKQFQITRFTRKCNICHTKMENNRALRLPVYNDEVNKITSGLIYLIYRVDIAKDLS